MYQIPVLSPSGRRELAADLPAEINPHLLWEVVRWQLAKRRRAARNLPWVVTLAPEGLNVYDIVRTERLVMDLDAWEVFQNRIGGEA